MPDELRLLEAPLRERLNQALSRGKVECRLSYSNRTDAARELGLNHALLKQLAHLSEALRHALPEAAPLSMSEVLRWPGMLSEDALPAEALAEAIDTLAQQAIEDLLATRAREGEKLGQMILSRVQAMRAHLQALEPSLPALLAEQQDKLTKRLREAVASLDEERIRQEVALFAIRIDVAEELNRLGTHLDEVTRVLQKGGAVGKRLDFLMQELNREANTLGSKSVATDQTATAVELKLLIEQMREQIQNLE
jgi:uncharacterized protein (TIGR00255 family)